MLKFLLWVWQLPQNIVGFILTRKYEFQSTVSCSINFPVFYKKNFFKSAISLGDYIILDYCYCGKKVAETIKKHEYGHRIQSILLGWLYLFVIGIPSISRNIYARIKNKNDQWYYSGFPEKWADELGNVQR